jgi:hypothetical protein
MNLFKKILIVVTVVIFVFVIVEMVNAAKYKMMVNVVDGENVMGVNPTTENLDFGDLSRNNGMTRYITMKNGGGMSLFIVVWKFGNISDLVKVDKNYFTLAPGEESKIAFNINVPPSAETKMYAGWVTIFRLPKI